MRFSIKHVFALFLFAAAVMGMWRFLIEPARHDAQSTACAGQLSYIAHALRVYDAAHGSLPLAATMDANERRAHSWRTALFERELIDYPSISGKYNYRDPWNSASNLVVAAPRHSWLLACPCDRQPKAAHTSYVVVVGANTLFPPDRAFPLSELPEGCDPIVLLEIAGDEVLWTEPRDLHIDELPAAMRGEGPGLRLSRTRHGGFRYITIGGEYGELPLDTSPKELRRLCEIPVADE